MFPVDVVSLLLPDAVFLCSSVCGLWCVSEWNGVSHPGGSWTCGYACGCPALMGFLHACCCGPAFAFVFTGLPRCRAVVLFDHSPAQGRGRTHGIWVPVLCFLKLSASRDFCGTLWQLPVVLGVLCVRCSSASEVILSDASIQYPCIYG